MKVRVLRVIFAFCTLTITSLFAAGPAQADFDFSVCAETQPGVPVSQACLNLMQAYPAPAVLKIEQDRYTLSNYAFWKVDTEYANVYEAPGAGVTRQFGQGFNFVRVISDPGDGWVQIATGEWMRSEDVRYVPPSFFQGVQVLDNLENRFGWALGDFFSSNTPGGRQDKENGRLLLRYDLINIFAEAYDDEGWRWYMIGPDQWIEQRLVAKPLPVERPEGVEGRWVAIDLYEQTLVAFENDTPIFATLVATGLPGTSTNEGVFEVWANLPRDRMSGSAGAPNGWDLQSVPWVMYFDGSISLHGTYWHDHFGYRKSRGCVNLSISDARFVYEWMNQDVDDDGSAAAMVYVYSSGEYRASGAATK
jgi:hypothetical protein